MSSSTKQTLPPRLECCLRAMRTSLHTSLSVRIYFAHRSVWSNINGMKIQVCCFISMNKLNRMITLLHKWNRFRSYIRRSHKVHQRAKKSFTCACSNIVCYCDVGVTWASSWSGYWTGSTFWQLVNVWEGRCRLRKKYRNAFREPWPLPKVISARHYI